VSAEKQPKVLSQRPTGFFSRRRVLGAVEKEGGDYALLACCLVTGMVDAASFGNWGVFVGMQTGKRESWVVFLAVREWSKGDVG
jgi:hypothetical protein